MQNRPLIALLLFTVISNYLTAQESIVKPVRRNPFTEDGIYISLQVGVNMDRMHPAGYLIDYLKFDKPTLPFFSALVDFDLDEEIKGLIFRLETSYKQFHFHASGDANKVRYDEYELKGRSWVPVVSVLYRLPWRWKLRPYGGIGIGYVSSNVSKNTLTIHNKPGYGNPVEVYENNFDLDLEQYALQYTVGLMYGKRFDLACRFLFSKFHRDDDHHHQLKNRPIMLAVGYRL